jgi:hypothetical protein
MLIVPLPVAPGARHEPPARDLLSLPCTACLPADRTAGRAQLDATVMRRAKLRSSMPRLNAAASWRCLPRGRCPGSPPRAFTTSRRCFRRGCLRSPPSMVLGTLVRTPSAPWCGRPHMACSTRGSAGVARHDPDRRSIDRGRCGDGRGPGDASEPRCHLSFASASRRSKAAAALLRDRRRSPASRAMPPGRPRG